MNCADRSARVPWLAARQTGVALLVFATTALGGWAMFEILRVNGITALQGIVLGLFVITFGWITIAFWTAIIGFLLQLTRRDPLTLSRLDRQPPTTDPGEHHTALVMPIYNEDPERVAAGLESTCHSLLEQPHARGFEVFVLSDTQDKEIARREETAIAGLQQRLAPRLVVHYRRREDNQGRKAGNLAEFCRRWGNRYDYLVVLDADSLMGGGTLVSLVASMQANPRIGLIQTVPIPVRSASVFGRFTQFAAALHSPLLATGQCFWQGHAVNFWGHNAILRTRAYMANCGLPDLPGKPPLGGEILSHDFVEAALMRRAGWEVHLDVRLGESYEEVPSNIIEFAKRDRRWIQGNLQHLRLLAAAGLHPMNRLHFLFGALAYLTSLLWGLMLVVSTVDAIGRAQGRHDFFSAGYQLFPDWPIATPELIMPLLLSTAVVLLLPKVLGFLLAFIQRPAAFGGRAPLLASTLLEVAIAILIAPLMMLLHSWFILSVLSGQKVSWDAQVREGRSVPWMDAFHHTWLATLIGVVWAGATYLFAPVFFWWLSPVWLGLLMAAPLVKMTSSLTHGRRLHRAGLLRVPAEVMPTTVLQALATGSSSPPATRLAPPPPEYPGDMPVQSFSTWPPVAAAALDDGESPRRTASSRPAESPQAQAGPDPGAKHE
ncbi:glucans biosynthesis glucosyltransferase MdoH [Halomonas sp. LR5S13]|uniref:glucans biosynthesis glucosyltransferase MdoH n=1 Tax=Halomonas rhizosphaerae TaxID=3043296 RepID=UPI0024A8DA3B|nr:glucans biosynthesis glucosyltransferase MdoH [Halomonas rhizosphaerae]MDI5923036.1 glucans biosynthesis glucosyltransferase MdoH [Halomonas rhizosphaerae]